MPTPTAAWRAMRGNDLETVNRIAGIIHVDYYEAPEVYDERLALCPGGCFVLEGAEGLLGYCVSHPWHAGRPPALNRLLGGLPAAPGTYYLHDIALLPGLRRSGFGSALVERLAQQAEDAGFSTMSLLAVKGSEPFWARHGFKESDAATGSAEIASYGSGVGYRVRALGDRTAV